MILSSIWRVHRKYVIDIVLLRRLNHIIFFIDKFSSWSHSFDSAITRYQWFRSASILSISRKDHHVFYYFGAEESYSTSFRNVSFSNYLTKRHEIFMTTSWSITMRLLWKYISYTTIDSQFLIVKKASFSHPDSMKNMMNHSLTITSFSEN